MKTVNVQERLREVREPLRCPVAHIVLTETGPGQPVFLYCNHYVSTEGLEQSSCKICDDNQHGLVQLLLREGDARRCPVCKHFIPEGAKMSDFGMATHILHDMRYPDKRFPVDGPMPPTLANSKMPTPLQALQSVDHSNLLGSRGEPAQLQLPIQQKRVIDDRPDASIPTHARYVNPYAYSRAERNQLMRTAEIDPESVPYKQLKTGDLVVSKSLKELQQAPQTGLERLQMKAIFSLGAISVALSSLMPCPSAAANDAGSPADATAAPAATVDSAPGTGGAYKSEEIERALSMLQWDRDHDVSVEDIISAPQHSPLAFNEFCRQTGRTQEQLKIDCLEAALERSLQVAGGQAGRQLVSALNGVRADGLSSRLFVVTGVEPKTFKAQVRRVNLGNLRRLQPLRNAWKARQMRGGGMKSSVPRPTQHGVDKEVEKLGAESDNMRDLGRLLFGCNRDEAWVEALLSDDDDAVIRDDFDGEEPGWKVYDDDDEDSDEEDD